MVRDGQIVVPTCHDCGCRLQHANFTDSEGKIEFNHYYGNGERDARGCICPSVDNAFFFDSEKVENFI